MDMDNILLGKTKSYPNAISKAQKDQNIFKIGVTNFLLL